jgi:hypothetical protein
LHCQSEGRIDADGKGEKFCRPTKKFSQASQIAEQSLTPTLSFREGGMKDNEKYLRWLIYELCIEKSFRGELKTSQIIAEDAGILSGIGEDF